ncbi:hypothetical protein HPB48_019521 [Haemaphysalis longicornis]|uniref:Uncharacterized protein n=1 Tax=Haemaphysalis longicornis TaxID=44386 RepID=A0A9J6GNS4_HAELO|nr:hypothetical protein HPB48_019521 [Haemaphysalis longicornis]
MYFRCLNNSDYNRGQYIFVARDEDSSEPGPGSCKKWQPDKVCAKDSAAHFRKEQECVKTCESTPATHCATSAVVNRYQQFVSKNVF